MAKNDREYAKVYDRARRKAMLRLRQAHQGHYEALLREEMEAEGVALRREHLREAR